MALTQVSIHALPKERDCDNLRLSPAHVVSIHALPKERDNAVQLCLVNGAVSIHALPKERDLRLACTREYIRQFQSTRSRKSATPTLWDSWKPLQVSIHALPKERDKGVLSIETLRTVSIHALPKERDAATRCACAPDGVSIHALPKERDHRRCRHHADSSSFNPRAPERARLIYDFFAFGAYKFQSTRSRKSAT